MVQDRELVLTGRRAAPAPQTLEKQVRLHMMEIDHGEFARRLQLPGDVDVEGIRATYKCGYLWIALPKRA